MPGSHVTTITDPCEFAAALRDIDIELLVTAKGKCLAEITTIDLPRLWMSRVVEPLPAIIRFSVPPGRAAITFPATAMQGTLHNNGAELPTNSLVIFGRASTNHVRTSGPLFSAGMSMPHEDLAAAGEAIVGVELAVPADSKIIRPAPADMSRLSALHEAIGQLAKTAPKLLTKPSVAKALEQELVLAMVRCLAGNRPTEPKTGSIQHNRVMARFEDFLESRRNEPIYLREICATIGVSERTLRTCCHEHLGIGPVRYLSLRRMYLARRALLRAEPKTTSVTAIATEHGFWELGRFSVEYRALFGEAPSVSLRRPSRATLARRDLH